MSDALCATRVLIHCLLGDYDQKMLHNPKNRITSTYSIPDNLPREQYDNLPKAYGVYEFKDAQGKPLYIGKANNIKKRVTQHFSTQKESVKYQRLMKSVIF